MGNEEFTYADKDIVEAVEKTAEERGRWFGTAIAAKVLELRDQAGVPIDKFPFMLDSEGIKLVKELDPEAAERLENYIRENK